MSVDAFVRRASSNLIRAAKAKDRETRKLRAEIKKSDRSIRKQVDKLEREIMKQEADLIGYNKSAPESGYDIAQIGKMKEEIKQIEKELGDKKAELEQQIKVTEDQTRELEKLANDLKARAGDF